MEKSLNYRTQRLKSMNPAEMVLRGYRIMRETVVKNAITFQQPYFSEEHFRKRNDLCLSDSSFGKSFLRTFRARKMFPWQELHGKELSALYSKKFSANKKKTLAVARDLLSHKFVLLGHQNNFGHEIDWHFDILNKNSVPVQFWTLIDYHDPQIVREIRYLWELNRHQHFVTLAKAFLISGDEKYSRELFSQWQHWLEKNPYQIGINWTSSLEVSLRLISWIWALYMVQNSASLTNDAMVKILQSIEQHAIYIEKHLSYFSSANNHLIGESLGLFYAGVYFPEFQRARVWRDKGYNIFNREILKQVSPDGVGKEQAIHYQLYNLYYAFLFRLAARAARIEIPASLNQILGKMSDFISNLAETGGILPNIGDADGGTALRLNELVNESWLELLNVAAIELHQSDLKRTSPEFTETAFWLCGIKGLKTYMDMAAAPAVSKVINYQQGGYIVINQIERPPSHLVFDCGPLGLGSLAAHGHADALNFLLNIKHEPVLIDCGTFLYLGAGEERNYFRGTTAHNTVCIDKTNQSEILGPFQWGRRARSKLLELDERPDQIFIRAWHNGYKKRSVIHERSLLFEKPSRWTVTDSLRGKGWHTIKIYFHTLSRRHKILADDQVKFQFKNFALIFSVSLKSDSHDSKMTLKVDQMAHSKTFGEKEMHAALIITVIGTLPMEIKTEIELR